MNLRPHQISFRVIRLFSNKISRNFQRALIALLLQQEANQALIHLQHIRLELNSLVIVHNSLIQPLLLHIKLRSNNKPFNILRKLTQTLSNIHHRSLIILFRDAAHTQRHIKLLIIQRLSL